MLAERTKKILLIVGFVCSVIGIGFLLYFLFLSPNRPSAITPSNQAAGNTAGGLPVANTGQPTTTTPTTGGQNLPEASEVANGGLTKTTVLTTARVSDVALSTDGKSMNYYDNTDGRFYTIAADGSVTKLSNKQFPDVSNATWNKSSEKAIIEFPDGSNVVYDFTSETQVTLPKHWEDFEFSPSNNTLIAKSLNLDSSNNTLLVANDDGSQAKAVQALGNNAGKVQVSPSPNEQIIAFSDTAGDQGGGMTQKMILPIGQNQENFKGLTVEGLGFESIWSPGGDILVYSTYGPFSDYKPLLWAVDGTVNSLGSDLRSLSINTWVEKCAFASDKIMYCAVPQELEANAGLQPNLSKNIPDDVYKIDLTTGRSNLIARPADNVVMSNLSVTADGSLLYFSNASNGRLEYIKLK